MTGRITVPGLAVPPTLEPPGVTRARVARWLRAPGLAVLAVLAGTALLVVAGMLPVWGTRLEAPQYPKGLDLWVYGGRSEGDLREINGLNHYIGMRTIDLDAIPELALWPLVVVGAGALLSAAVFLHGRLGRLALLGLWLVPVGILADIQRWLLRYGTDLDPTAALRLDPFVPLAIGPTTVWNFTIWTYPGPALGLLAIVALGATVARRAELPPVGIRAAVSAVALAALIAATVLVVMPAVAVEADEAGEARASPPAGMVDLEALIANAPAGATVVVPAGSYVAHLVIDRPLTLVADGEVLLDGNGRGTVVTVAAPDVTIRGFRVENSGGQVEEAAGIKILADRARIEGNRIERAFTGIAVLGATEVEIVDNEIVGTGRVTAGAGHATEPADEPLPSPAPAATDPHAAHAPGAGPAGQGDGISLWNTSGTLIRGNRIEQVRDGVYLNYADDVLLDGNTVTNSRYAVHAMFGRDVVAFGNVLTEGLSGLVFMYTEDVLAGRNTITDNRSPGTGFGIVLKDVRGVRLSENVVARNRTGLQVEGTVATAQDEGLVSHNRFAANLVGVALMATADLSFAGNAFDGNLTQILALEPGVERHNRWTDRGYGNTWSDYAGFDLAGDGLGDVPHRSGGAAGALVGEDPALEVYRTSPAFHVLEAAQAAWDAGRATVVHDANPLTTDVAPPLADAPIPGGDWAWYLLGAGLAVPSALALALARPRAHRRGLGAGAGVA